jgi:hypothetical protein
MKFGRLANLPQFEVLDTGGVERDRGGWHVSPWAFKLPGNYFGGFVGACPNQDVGWSFIS